MQKIFTIILVFVFFFGLNRLSGQETEAVDTNAVEHSEESNYHFSIFTGFTSNLEHKTDDFTLGVDYSQRLPFLDRMFAVGVILEAVFAEHKENILAIPIIAHLDFIGMNLFLAPGVIFGERTIDNSNLHSNLFKKDKILEDVKIEETESYSEFLMRLGIGYNFHYEILSISPIIAFDFYNGNTSIVWGIGVGLSL